MRDTIWVSLFWWYLIPKAQDWMSIFFSFKGKNSVRMNVFYHETDAIRSSWCTKEHCSLADRKGLILMVGHSVLIAVFSTLAFFSWETWKFETSFFKGRGSRQSNTPFGLSESFSIWSKPKEKHIKRGKSKHPLRTTKAFLGCAEVQLEKQNLSSILKCPKISKNTRKHSSGM